MVRDCLRTNERTPQEAVPDRPGDLPPEIGRRTRTPVRSHTRGPPVSSGQQKPDQAFIGILAHFKETDTGFGISVVELVLVNTRLYVSICLRYSHVPMCAIASIMTDFC